MWNHLNKRDRQMLATFGGVIRPTLTTRAVLDACEVMDATREDYEKVLLIEDTAYPILSEEWHKKKDE